MRIFRVNEVHIYLDVIVARIPDAGSAYGI